jgi:hypothetical protein
VLCQLYNPKAVVHLRIVLLTVGSCQFQLGSDTTQLTVPITRRCMGRSCACPSVKSYGLGRSCWRGIGNFLKDRGALASGTSYLKHSKLCRVNLYLPSKID